MPILFKVNESAGGSASYFAYPDISARIGEPSAFGVVYRGEETDQHGINSAAGEWAIKESNSPEHVQRFRREYETLRDLAQATRRLTGAIYSPYPVYLLEREDTGSPGIAMPLYRVTLRELIAEWDEQQITHCMVDYLNVIRALHDINYICTDRKLDDLRWHDQHLVVIDWNVLRPYEPASVQLEINLTARIWYLLLTGYEPSALLNPFNDAEWQPFGASREGGRISIGLRFVLSYAMMGRYESVEAFRAAVSRWHEEWLTAGIKDSRASEELETWFRISQRKAEAVLADLDWRSGRADSSVRQNYLLMALQQTDGLDDIREMLDDARRALNAGRFDNAYDLIQSIHPQGDIQTAAVERWKLLIGAFRSNSLGREQREDLRSKYSEKLTAGLGRLERPLLEDETAETHQPLSDLKVAYQAALDIAQSGAAYDNLFALNQEIALRETLLDIARVRRAMPETSVFSQLSRVIELAQEIPYVASILNLEPLETELEESRRAQAVREEVDQEIETIRVQAADLLRNWRPPSQPPDFTPLLTYIDAHEKALARHPIQLEKFVGATLSIRRLIRFVQFGYNRTPVEVAQGARELTSSLGAVPDAIHTALRGIVEYVANQAADQVEIALDKGESSLITDAARILPPANDEAVRTFVPPNTLERFAVVRARLDAYRELVTFINTQPNSLEVIRKALDLKIAPTSPLVKSFLDKAMSEAAGELTSIRSEFNNLKNAVNHQIAENTNSMRLSLEEQRRELQNKFYEFDKAQNTKFETATSAIHNEIGELRAQNEQINKTVKGLRMPVIAGFAILSLLVVGVVALVFVINNGVSQQTTDLQTRVAQGQDLQNTLATHVSDSFATATAAAATTLANVQAADTLRWQTATAEAQLQMQAIQTMIDTSIAAAIAGASAESTPEVTIAEQTAEAPEQTAEAPQSVPTFDRTGETLASALLTSNEQAAFLLWKTERGIAESGVYMLQFPVGENGQIIDFIQPESTSEFEVIFNEVSRKVRNALDFEMPLNEMTSVVGVREQGDQIILYPAVRYGRAYAEQPANSLQLFQTANLARDTYFPLTPQTGAVENRIAFIAVNSNLVAILQSTLAGMPLPIEGELLAAQVVDGRIVRVFVGNQPVELGVDPGSTIPVPPLIDLTVGSG